MVFPETHSSTSSLALPNIGDHATKTVIAGEGLREVMQRVDGVEPRVAAPPLHPESLCGRPELLDLPSRCCDDLQQHHVFECLLGAARRRVGGLADVSVDGREGMVWGG